MTNWWNSYSGRKELGRGNQKTDKHHSTGLVILSEDEGKEEGEETELFKNFEQH